MMHKRMVPLAALMAVGAVTLSAGYAAASPVTRTSTQSAAHTSAPNTTKDGNCEDGEFCLFSEVTGDVFDTAGGDSNMTQETFPLNPGLLVTSNVQSAFNQTQKTWAAYDGADFTGNFVCYAPGEATSLPDNFQVRSVGSASAAKDCA